MTEKKLNIFQQFVFSLYSFKHYPQLGRTHGGKVFLYSLLMVCITYVITFIIPTLDVIPYIYKIDTDMVDEYVPYFEITNGEFYIENELFYEDEDASLIIYATSDYVIPADSARDILRAYTQGFIVSAEDMVIKQATGEITEYTFHAMPDLSRDSLYDLIPIIKVLIVVMYVLVFIGYIAVYMFGTLVCALLGQFINLFIKAPTTFGTVFKLSAYARTMPILIKMIFALFTSISLNFVLFYILFAVYMVFALKMVKQESETAELEDYTADPQHTMDNNYDRSNPYDDNTPREN